MYSKESITEASHRQRLVYSKMFNHPNHGSMTSQIAHIQRTMAYRLQGSNTFLGNMNGWNRGFGTSNLMGRSEFSNYGSGSSVSYPQTEMNQTSGSEFIGNSSIRMPIFKCPECSIVKNTSEDFEIHVKVEHLNWLPFICPMCKAARASDIQMREHMHSSHKKNDNMYWYQDNAQAKKILQEMMDKALFAASIQHKQSNISKLGRIIGDSNGNLQSVVNTDNELAKRIRLDDVVTPSIRRNIEESLQSKNQNVNENISSTSGIKLAGQEPKPSIDEETDSQLSTIFGRNIKSEFDMTVMEEDSPSQQSLQTINEDDELHDNTHQMNALQNMAAMFSASSGSVCQKVQPKSVLDSRSSRPFPYKRVVRNRPGPMTSKKRVLGVCARCNKPITAGARQMHMFFHLGKDMQTFRFRCRHSGCDVEHYRKDQMENHQSKVHGQVDPNMMDDRSQELYNLVQKMSMELLGTMGNTPGPTAAKAQLMYEQQMRDVAANLGSRKRPPIQMFTQHQQIHTNINGMFDSANRKMEDLECRLCHKTIMSRIRGFHILWHLNNDLGIVRYGCKHCDFKHDRPQSVVGHGAREHADEYCCEDLLYNFEDELKSMSKACFGVERLFEKEIRRRTRMELYGNIMDDDLRNEDELEDDDSRGSCDSKLLNQTPLAKLDVQLKAESSDRSWSSSKEQMRKKRSFRRFGTRVRSRRQREDMIKLREVSMRLGGAQYFKKKSNEAVLCEKCGKMISNRLSDHAYSHLDGCDLFRCQQCNLGHYSRETIVRHLRDFHNSSDEPPLDNRLRFAQEIKDAIRECYPNLFVDAPIPTKEDIEKMKANLKLEKMVLISEGEDDGNEDKAEEDGEEEEEDEQEDEVDDEEDQKKEDEEETHVETDSAKEMDTHEEDRDEDNEHNAEVEEEEELSRDGDDREGSEEGEQEDDIKEEDGEDESVVGFDLGGTYDNEEKHEVMNQSNDEERMEARNDGQQKRSRRGRPPKEGKEVKACNS